MFLLDRVQINTHGVVLHQWKHKKRTHTAIFLTALQNQLSYSPEDLACRPRRADAPQSLQDAIGYSDPKEWKENQAHQISKCFKRRRGKGY